jgi:putative MATE family efflux protein
MVGGLVDIDLWIRIVGATPDMLPYSRDYLQIILIGMFFQTFAMAMNFLIRAEGNAKVPMIGMMIGAVSNIALDAIFIILLDMGVQGAALATIIAQFFSVIYFAYYYLKGKSLLALHFRNLRLEWKIMSSIVAIGFASFAHMLANSFSVIIINRMLGNYGGDIAISVYGVLNRIAMFALMPGIVIGQGMQPILGYNYGAKRYARALKALKIAIAAATIWCGVAFVLLYFLPEPFIRIFASEAEIITMGAYAAKRIFLVIYVVGFIIVSSTAFQALGKVPQSIISSTARSVLFLIPALLIMPQYLGLDGVWLAFPLTDVLTFMVAVALLLPQVRILQKAIKEQTMQVPASEA